MPHTCACIRYSTALCGESWPLRMSRDAHHLVRRRCRSCRPQRMHRSFLRRYIQIQAPTNYYSYDTSLNYLITYLLTYLQMNIIESINQVTLGHADCAQLLLDCGANANHQDKKGRTYVLLFIPVVLPFLKAFKALPPDTIC